MERKNKNQISNGVNKGILSHGVNTQVPTRPKDPLRGSVPYLLQSMRVMMRNSFLTKYMQGAHMPHDVDRYMEGSSNNGHDHSYHHSQTKVLEKKV